MRVRGMEALGGQKLRADETGSASSQPAALPASEVQTLLVEGDIEACQQIPWGSNYTFCATLRLGAAQIMAVYKPQRGERPLWDFPAGTLYLREYAAYLASQLMGWPFVPMTVVRDGPHGVGSMQLYVDAAPLRSMRELEECQDQNLSRIAAFDIITNNADRKGGHVLRDDAGKLWAIDHGLCFNRDPKVRTVLQRFCGDPVPAAVLAELRAFSGDVARRKLARDWLGPVLAHEEMDAFERRVERLAAEGEYPRLDHYRSVPWPPF